MHKPNTLLQTFFLNLYGIGAVKINSDEGFLLKAHEQNPKLPPSPFFINLRTADNPNSGPLDQRDVNQVAKFFWAYTLERDIDFGGVAGVPNAGNPLAKALVAEAYHASGMEKHLLTLAKMTGGGKRHVGKLLKTGYLPRGSRVIVVDDVATKAGSKEETVEQLRIEGFQVTDCLVFLDREQGARKNLQKIQVALHAIATASELFAFYRNSNLIDEKTHQTVAGYLAA